MLAELKRRNVFRVGAAYAVVAWFIVQAGDIMLQNFGAPEWAFKTIAGVLALGFPLALFLAWAYELTPEGVKRAANVESEQSATSKTGTRIDRLIVFGLIAVISVLVIERVWFAGTDTDTSPAGPPNSNPAMPISAAGSRCCWPVAARARMR